MAVQALLRCLSPSHGRALIYVWATQQDELSKRSIPSPPTTSPVQDEQHSEGAQSGTGKDVFVPWTLTSVAPQGDSEATPNKKLILKAESTPEKSTSEHQQRNELVAFNRYYHMFDKGELRLLVKEAATEIGIEEQAETDRRRDCSDSDTAKTFLEFVRDDWERSNFYVELRLWTM